VTLGGVQGGPWGVETYMGSGAGLRGFLETPTRAFLFTGMEARPDALPSLFLR
jgi:hypothetical protein